MPEWKVPGYTELKALGSGGFGEVVLARHDGSGNLVAIKYLHGDLLADAEFAEMFRIEAATLAAIDDPNVVRLYEYVESAAGVAIVMELIGGVSVRDLLRFQGKTTPEAALAVLRGSLLGLAAAHRRGVVHRDYKPENVLVDGAGVSKLTDFGIAARAGTPAIPAGTWRYAAPEQMAGGPATPASDVYAATVTFYECLTGRVPVSGETRPLDPVPAPLRPLVFAGMAADPGQRPADAASFVEGLDAAATGAYGRHWRDRGRSHLAEAALLLSALWPAGAPPAVQGTSVHWLRLRHRRRHHSQWQAGAAKSAVAAGAVVVAAGAGTAFALNRAQQPVVSSRPAAAQQQRVISLRPSPLAARTAAPRHSSVTIAGAVAPATTAASSRASGPATPAASTPASVPASDPVSRPAPAPVSTTVSTPASTPVSTPAAPKVPQITSVSTYTHGQLVYFYIQYADPGKNAAGFGFVGVHGSGWAEENHPFSSPSYGIVGPGSIAYPFNEACGTPNQYASYVQAWIYDTGGVRSTPVTIHLICT